MLVIKNVQILSTNISIELYCFANFVRSVNCLLYKLHVHIPLKPIIAEDFLERVQIDLIDLRHMPNDEHEYIGQFVDHFIKFYILFPLKSKRALEVAEMFE